MDQSSVKPLINKIISTEEKKNYRINLCLEHIVTNRLYNYKCILNKNTSPKYTLDQVDLNEILSG